MASALASLKHEWRLFRHDKPGERFCNHRKRTEHRPAHHAALSLVLGIILMAAGIVLLFIPGPGLPLIVFGLALFATHSARLARLLDRAEPVLRRRGHHLIERWKAMSRAAKAGVIASAALVVCAFMLATWKWVVAAYLL